MRLHSLLTFTLISALTLPLSAQVTSSKKPRVRNIHVNLNQITEADHALSEYFQKKVTSLTPKNNDPFDASPKSPQYKEAVKLQRYYHSLRRYRPSEATQNFKFAGGVLSDLQQQIKKTYGVHAPNIIFAGESANLPLPPFEVRAVSPNKVLWVTEQLSEGTISLNSQSPQLVVVRKNNAPSARNSRGVTRDQGVRVLRPTSGPRVSGPPAGANLTGLGPRHPKVLAAKAVKTAAAPEKKRIRVYSLEAYIDKGAPKPSAAVYYAPGSLNKKKTAENKNKYLLELSKHNDKQMANFEDFINVAFKIAEVKKPKMQFHQGTKTIILSGSSEQLKTAESVLSGLGVTSSKAK